MARRLHDRELEGAAEVAAERQRRERDDAAFAQLLQEAGAPAWTRDLENAPDASPEDMALIAAMANAAGDQSPPPRARAA